LLYIITLLARRSINEKNIAFKGHHQMKQPIAKIIATTFAAAFSTTLLASLIVACVRQMGNDPDEQIAATQALRNQKIVFEAEYVNYAWGYQHKGIVVDNQGNVYEYDRKGTRWMHDEKEPLREQDLLNKYINTKPLRTLDAATLRDKFALALAIKNDVSDMKSRCADAGTWTLWAYQQTNGVYAATLLFRAGDIAQENRSASARELTAWVRALDERLKTMPCEP
jgi:hypothetical protein